MHLLKKILPLILFSLLFLSVSAQIRPMSGGDFEGEENIDSKKKKEEKPKIKPKIQLWYWKQYGAFVDSTKLDTLQTLHRLYHPALKDKVSVAFTGNYGFAYQNNDFFERIKRMDFFFINTRADYLLSPERVVYYNTRTPYTQLDYSQSENKSRKNETRFNVLHTQNVNPYWNLTFRYDQARSDGQYLNQNAKNNFVSVYTNYNKDQISAYGGFISNFIKNKENGGLVDMSSLSSGYDSDVLDVNLAKTQTVFNNWYAYAVGEYKLGNYKSKNDTVDVFNPIVGIMYNVQYQRNKKRLKEEESVSETPFFKQQYYVDDYIEDKVTFNKLENTVQLMQYENRLRKFSFGKRAFLGHEYVSLGMPGTDTLGTTVQKSYNNVYVGGGIFRETGNFWRWNISGKINILGRNAGETEIKGLITKPIPLWGDSLSALKVYGRIANTVPDYFQEHYSANHIKWNQNLKMQQDVTIKGSFEYPKRNIEVGVNYAILNNFIYNDTLGIPSQTSNEFSVFSVYLNKDFRFRNFHFITRLLYQKSTDERYLRLPDFAAFVSTYYKFTIFKVMFTQIGIDARYNTRYYADAYHPATGLFHLQDEIKLGNYPFVDAYVSLRLKRTRAFFKLINVGSSFLDANYVTVPNHPMNRMTFRLGISWIFYD